MIDAPRIQYARTRDNVMIAYWTLGEGVALVYAPSPTFNHIQLEWQIPELRRFFHRLAQGRMVVRFDNRGCGLSDRDPPHYSLDSLVADLEAVVDRLGLKRFALLGAVHAGPTAIAFAARHPERVSHLLLWCSYRRAADYEGSTRARALRGLMESDWELYAANVAQHLLGYAEGEQSRAYAKLIREATTPEAQREFYVAQSTFDVTELLSRLRCPTLVLHRREARYPVALARDLAANIADARLVLLEGTSSTMALGDMEAVARAIDEFLGTPHGVVTAEQPDVPHGTAVILFTDIAGSTALTTRLGDAAYREKERELDGALRAAIQQAGGQPVDGKVLGDGVMAIFASAREAIECSLACRSIGEAAGLPLHLGIHAGDVMREGPNVHGGAVQMAARIADASAPSEVLVSQTVRDLARTSAAVPFEDRGEYALRGFEDPVHLYEVRWRAEGSP